MSGPLKDDDGENVEHVHEALYLPRDVARLLNVHPVTLARWAKKGKIISVRTPGNHRRYPASAVRAAMEGRWEDACVKGSEWDLHYKDTTVVYLGD